MIAALSPRALWFLRALAAAIITGLVVYDRSCRWEHDGRIYCPQLGYENGFLGTIGVFALALVLVMIIERLRAEHFR